MGIVATEFRVRIVISDMSKLRLISFYFNSAGGTHVIGYLMLASTEAPIKSITIVTANRLQKACAKLILKTISKLEKLFSRTVSLALLEAAEAAKAVEVTEVMEGAAEEKTSR